MARRCLGSVVRSLAVQRTDSPSGAGTVSSAGSAGNATRTRSTTRQPARAAELRARPFGGGRARLPAGIDDRFLPGGEASDVDDGVYGDGPPDQGEGDRPVLGVPHGGQDRSRDPSVDLDRGARRRQCVERALQVQFDQAPRRTSEVDEFGNRLLPSIAAFVQVHGRAQPVEFVRQGLRLDVLGLRAPSRKPRSLPCERAGGRVAGVGEPRDRLVQVPPLDEDDEPSPPLSRVGRSGRRVSRTARGRTRPWIGPYEGDGFGVGDLPPRIARLRATIDRTPDKPIGRMSAETSDRGEVLADRDFDAHREAHRIEEVDPPGSVAGIGDKPGRLAVLDREGGVLDVPGRAEEQGLRRIAGSEPDHALARQGVEPSQPVRPRDAHDVPVGEVHESPAAVERPVLGGRVAVVQGRPAGVRRPGSEHRLGVGDARRHRTVQIQRHSRPTRVRRPAM